MAELHVTRRPALDRPVLIAAFRGWNDGGQGASLAAGYLAKTWDASRFAEIDPEGFFDFQATRPHVKLEEGLTRRIDWPETVFYHGRPEGMDRDAVLLLGVEPNLRWRTFSGLIVDFAQELGVELVVTLGALLADVPHTRHAGHRQRDRPRPDRAARAPGLPLRGPDRDRRRRARRLQAGRHPVGEPLGGRAALRVARPEPEGGRGALRPARHAARRGDRHDRARPGLGRLRPAGQRGDRLGRGDGGVRRGARAQRRRASTRATCPRASRSPPSSRGSCASARRTAARVPVLPQSTSQDERSRLTVPGT